ncbi:MULTISPECIES: hypothetical protein [Burkholderia]|uniref:hypothetical protein n=1 Tax=Burkholderia TaxID=32008 RepID=UPI000DAC634A|nr:MULTISPECIES: hypothetical protein [Burkholderia]MDP9547231.1 hypothetical protein [Burkholderia cepacia]MBR8391974.1 hypothetical protein [Burkholderia cenocepacia]MBR8471778.1 hypothetical protein [Burkholderia cenocepacia]MBR8490817.1 hypothetical protein [Burkholderia cenocepacia]MDO5918360.1 hypothetical protein [Burkholderia cenocepacia]
MPTHPVRPPVDRSLRTHAYPQRWLSSIALLTPALYASVWFGLPLAWRYWRAVMAWGAQQIDPALHVIVLGYPPDAPRVPLLSIDVAARLPGGTLLLATAALCAIGFAASFVRRTRWLPVAYLLRIASFTQLLICAYFWLAPDTFPYVPPLHLRDMFVLHGAAIALIPLVMAALYYPLDFSLLQKAVASLLVLGYFVFALPFVMLLHATIIHHGSLLFLPFCYFLLGGPLLIGLLVTLYTYCASWPGALTRDRDSVC